MPMIITPRRALFFQKNYLRFLLDQLRPLACWPLNDTDTTCRNYAYGQPNLLANPGFETAGAGGADVFASWSEVASDGAIARTTTAGEFNGGIAAAKLTSGASLDTRIRTADPAPTASPGLSYQWSFWTRGDGTNAGRYAIYDATSGLAIINTTSTGVTSVTYAQVSGSVTAPAGCTGLYFYFYGPEVNGGIAYFDDCSLTGPSGTLYFNGTHTGTTPLQGGLAGRTSQYYDGTTDRTSLALAALFNSVTPTLFSVSIWGKVSAAAIWTDGTKRTLFRYAVDASNSLEIYRTTTNNQLQVDYIAGGTTDSVAISTSTLDWFHVVATVNVAADELKVYFNGAQSGTTQATLGTWAGVGTIATIGASTAAGANPWSGWGQYGVMRNSILTAAEVDATYRKAFR